MSTWHHHRMCCPKTSSRKSAEKIDLKVNVALKRPSIKSASINKYCSYIIIGIIILKSEVWAVLQLRIPWTSLMASKMPNWWRLYLKEYRPNNDNKVSPRVVVFFKKSRKGKKNEKSETSCWKTPTHNALSVGGAAHYPPFFPIYLFCRATF